MTEKELEEKGYNHFAKGHGCNLFNDSICDGWQKCIKDKIGKKYFITVWKWDWTKYKHGVHKDIRPYSFGTEVQLYTKPNHNAVSMEFHTEDITEIEKNLEDMWNSGMWEYYELM